MIDYIFMDGSRVENSLPLRSLFYGEGLFETFRHKNRLPVLFDKHLERMEAGAKLLKVPFPEKEYIKELVEKAILESELKDAYVKICLLSDGESAFNKMSKESQALVIVKKYLIPKHSVKIKINSCRRISESPLLNVKSLNYLENILARREASGSGFDEALFLNERDEVAECSTSNIFWFNGETLFTPSIECGLLSGTTRDLILNFIPEHGVNLVEGRFSLRDLTAAEFVFITNSLIGCAPVFEVEGNILNPEHNYLAKIKNTLLKKLEWE
ncbi:MAG: aminotransferase class IV family protein [Candidatus Dadabacteria bacterium]|nr:aminotransferase class IV family protein [Candidatus Dadabacteria bacterium]